MQVVTAATGHKYYQTLDDAGERIDMLELTCEGRWRIEEIQHIYSNYLVTS